MKADPLRLSGAVLAVLVAVAVRKGGATLGSALALGVALVGSLPVTWVAKEARRRMLWTVACCASIVSAYATMPWSQRWALACLATLLAVTVSIGHVAMGGDDKRALREARKAAERTDLAAAYGSILPPGSKRLPHAGPGIKVRVPADLAHRLKLDDLRTQLAAKHRVARDRVTVTLDANDPSVMHATIAAARPFSGARAPLPAWEPGTLSIAHDADGQPLGIPLDLTSDDAHHILVVGRTGSGKTNTVKAIIDHLAAAAVPTWGYDPKGKELASRAHLFDRYFRGPEECRAGLIEAAAEMRRRQREGFVAPMALVLDELADIVRGRKGRDAAEAHVTLATLGRSEGIILIGSTQSPRASLFGDGEATGQYPRVIAHQVKTMDENAIALGRGSIAEGADCRRLPKGRAWIVGPGVDGYQQIQVVKAADRPAIARGNVNAHEQADRGAMPTDCTAIAPSALRGNAPVQCADRLLVELRAKPRTALELTTLTGHPQRTVYKALAQLAADGRVVKPGRQGGPYRTTSTPTTLREVTQ